VRFSASAEAAGPPAIAIYEQLRWTVARSLMIIAPLGGCIAHQIGCGHRSSAWRRAAGGIEMRIRLVKSIEGNYGLPGQMRGAREDLAVAEGRGPNPATKDTATDFVGVEGDPSQ
jgi:hypothetical protein